MLLSLRAVHRRATSQVRFEDHAWMPSCPGSVSDAHALRPSLNPMQLGGLRPSGAAMHSCGTAFKLESDMTLILRLGSAGAVPSKLLKPRLVSTQTACTNLRSQVLPSCCCSMSAGMYSLHGCHVLSRTPWQAQQGVHIASVSIAGHSSVL